MSWTQVYECSGNVAGVTNPITISGNVTSNSSTGNGAVTVVGNLYGVDAPARIAGNVGSVGNVYGITSNVVVYGNLTGTGGNGVMTFGGNVPGITAPVTLAGTLSLLGNVGGVTLPVLVSNVLSSVQVYGDVSNVTGNVSGVTAPIRVSSVAGATTVYGDATGVLGNVYGVTAPVPVTGAIGNVSGNVGGVTLPVLAASIAGGLSIFGDVGNVTGNVYGVTSQVFVVGTLYGKGSGVANSVVVANVANVTRPVPVRATVTSVHGNVAGVTAPVSVSSVDGTVGATGGDLAASALGNIYGITLPVRVRGVLSTPDAGGLTISGNVAGITAPLRIRGDVALSGVGNAASVLSALTVYGNVSISGNVAGVTAQATVSAFLAPLRVSGNVSNVSGNIPGITAPVTIVGNLTNVTGNVSGITAPVQVTAGTSLFLGNASASISGNIPGVAQTSGVTINSIATITNRAQTSESVTQFAFKRNLGLPDAYQLGPGSMTTANSGTGNVVMSNSRGTVVLYAGGAAGNAKLWSRARCVVPTGLSATVRLSFLMTNFGLQSNLVQQVGYYDPSGGAMFRATGSALAFVFRSNVTGATVETVANQSTWNIDKLDGTGASGQTLVFDKSQILIGDFGYGTGLIRLGFSIGGRDVYAHSIATTGGVAPAIGNLNFFPTWEIRVSGTISAAAPLEALGGAVTTECASGVAGEEPTGVDRSVSTGTTFSTFPLASTYYEVLAIRVKGNGYFYPTRLSVTTLAPGSRVFAVLYVNRVAVTPRTWVSVPGSIVECSRTVTTSTGALDRIIGGWYGYTPMPDLEIPKLYNNNFGVIGNGMQETLSVILLGLTTNPIDYHASISWREVY